MKNYNLSAMAIAVFAFALMLTSCQEDSFETLGSKGLIDESYTGNTNGSLSTSPVANLYGKPLKEWTKEWWHYTLGFDCASSPLFQDVLLSTAAGKSGPIHCLVGAEDGKSVRYVDITKDKTLLVSVFNTIQSYPNPDANFKPAPGQSVEKFLKQEAASVINQPSEKKAFLDGKPISITASNRIATDVFTIKAEKELGECLECVNGETQIAVSDGYYLVIKGLARGKHTLRIQAKVPQEEVSVDVTYNITVRG
ncbi:MAG: hypothetical protein ABIQ11_04715 [Saprospiraceae bacterium]